MAALEETASKDNSWVKMRIYTDKPVDIFKADADQELQYTWVSLALRRRWDRNVCTITTFGLTGTLKIENQYILADIHLSTWLPTWYREKALNDIRRSMKIVSQYSRTQEEAAEGRERLKDAAHKTHRDAHRQEFEAHEVIRRWQSIDEVSKVAIGLTTGTGSIMSLVESHAVYWTWLTAFGAAVAIVQTAFRITDRLRKWNEIHSDFNRLAIDLETFQDHMRIDPSFPVEEFQKKYSDFRERFREASARIAPDILLNKKMKARVERMVSGSAGIRGREPRPADGTFAIEAPT